MPSMARSTTGRVEPSLSSGVMVGRRSNALSIMKRNSATAGTLCSADFLPATFLVVAFLAGLRVGLIDFLLQGRPAARCPAPAVVFRRVAGHCRRHRRR